MHAALAHIFKIRVPPAGPRLAGPEGGHGGMIRMEGSHSLALTNKAAASYSQEKVHISIVRRLWFESRLLLLMAEPSPTTAKRRLGGA